MAVKVKSGDLLTAMPWVWEEADVHRPTYHHATQVGYRHREACLPPQHVKQTEEVTQRPMALPAAGAMTMFNHVVDR